MIITILSPGKTKASYLQKAIEDFAGRLKHFTRLEYKEVKVKGQNSKHPDLQKECQALLSHIPPSSYVVCLDILGKQFSSEQFADFIQRKENQSTRQICFVIGGPLGLDPSIVAKAHLRISFSKMTFTHDMARFLLLEQLYRAYAIKNGTGYHK